MAIVAFKHVLNIVFEVPDDGPLAKALEQAGYDNIWTLITLQDEDIEAHLWQECYREGHPLGKGSPESALTLMTTAQDRITLLYDALELHFLPPLQTLLLNQLGLHPSQWRKSSMG